jgi:hypothetical protein
MHVKRRRNNNSVVALRSFVRIYIHTIGLTSMKYSHITVETGYNDIGLYDTSLIASDVLWY